MSTGALLGFSALHVPVWGWGFAVGGLASGAAAMASSVWRRDLLAMMVVHTFADATGLIIAREPGAGLFAPDGGRLCRD